MDFKTISPFINWTLPVVMHVFIVLRIKFGLWAIKLHKFKFSYMSSDVKLILNDKLIQIN